MMSGYADSTVMNIKSFMYIFKIGIAQKTRGWWKCVRYTDIAGLDKNSPSDSKVSRVTSLLNGPVPSAVVAATRKVYSVPHLRSMKVTDFKDVWSEMMPKRDTSSYEYLTLSLPRTSHGKSCQDIVNESSAKLDAATPVGAPVGTVT